MTSALGVVRFPHLSIIFRLNYSPLVAGQLLLCLSAMSGLLRAETDALRVEDTVEAREIAPGSSLRFSPNGTYLAYTVVRGHAESASLITKNVPWFAQGADVHVIDLTTNKEETITGGQHSNWAPVWSADGRHLAFLSDRDPDGETNLWVWDTKSRRVRKVSTISAKPGALEWTRDGRAVVFSAFPRSPISATILNDGLPQKPRTDTTAVRLYNSGPESDETARADPWNLDEYSTELVLADLSSAKTRVILRERVGSYELSPDGSRIALTVAKRFATAGSQQILFDLIVLALESGERRTVVTDVRLGPDGSGFSWSPDSRRLCLKAKDPNKNIYNYLVADVAQQVVLTISGSFQPPSIQEGKEPLWDGSGHIVYFVHDGELWRGDAIQGVAHVLARIAGRHIVELVPRWPDQLQVFDQKSTLVLTHDDEGKQDGVYAVNLSTGESTRLLEQGQCYTCVLDEESVVVSQDEQRIAFVAEDAAHSPEVWTSGPGFKDLRQLTGLNPQFDPHAMGKARLIDWLSDDGERLHGALLLPPNYRAGERYPLVTYIYGGASLSNRFDRFGLAGAGPLNMQLLATRGYAVLLPDAPQHLGSPMLDLAKTILPGVSKSIELGIADPDRVAVVGHSYGAYSALCLIVQTARFKAAISIAGTSDLLGLYGEMQDDGSAYGIALAEDGQGAMGGTPWVRRDSFIENSPFFYFDRVQTPLLIIQGSDDSAVAPFLGDQMFVALRRLGKEAAYAKYAGEGHSPAQEWSYANQVDLSYRMIRWLDSHLKTPSTP